MLAKWYIFFWQSGLSPSDNDAPGQGSVSIRTCQRLVSKFEDGKIDCSDRTFRTTIPSLWRSNNIDFGGRQIRSYVTTRQIAEELGVCHETIRKKLNGMGKRYLVNKWIPYRQSEANKFRRKTLCETLLFHCEQNNFLLHLITVDEVWIYRESESRIDHGCYRSPGDDGVTSEFRNSMTQQETYGHCVLGCRSQRCIDADWNYFQHLAIEMMIEYIILLFWNCAFYLCWKRICFDNYIKKYV